MSGRDELRSDTNFARVDEKGEALGDVESGMKLRVEELG